MYTGIKDRSFNDARVFQHHFYCSWFIDIVLDFFIQLAPCCATFIENGFPANLLDPLSKVFLWYAQFLVVMELVSNTIFIKPLAGFFYGVAVRDTIHFDHYENTLITAKAQRTQSFYCALTSIKLKKPADECCSHNVQVLR